MISSQDNGSLRASLNDDFLLIARRFDSRVITGFEDLSTR